jgi:hypothetical protein
LAHQGFEQLFLVVVSRFETGREGDRFTGGQSGFDFARAEAIFAIAEAALEFSGPFVVPVPLRLS